MPRRLSPLAALGALLALAVLVLYPSNARAGLSNDQRAGAIEFTDIPYTIITSSEGATMEDGESTACGAAATVWFKWTPTENVAAVIETYGSDIDPTLAVFRESDGGMIACNDDYRRGFAKVSIIAAAGQTYLIQLGGFHGATGIYHLTVDDSLNYARIFGDVTSQSSGLGIEDICVVLYDTESEPSRLARVSTEGADGHYLADGLLPGMYNVTFQDCQNRDYGPVYFNGALTQDTATTITVLDKQIISDVNAALEDTAEISGRVTDSASGDPISNICIQAISSGSPFAGGAKTDGNGEYVIRGLNGTYTLFFVDCDEGGRYPSMFYPGVLEFDQSTSIGALAPNHLADKNMALAPAAMIDGTTINKKTGAPVQDACVGALIQLPGDDVVIASGTSEADGSFHIGALAAGDYRLIVSQCGDTRFLDFYYDEADFANAEIITVVAGQQVSDIDINVPLSDIMGDGDCSGFVNMDDFIAGLRYLARFTGISCGLNFNVDCQGAPPVDTVDLLALLKWFAFPHGAGTPSCPAIDDVLPH